MNVSGGSPDVTSTSLVDVFNAQMEAYAARDIDALLLTFSSDCVLQDMGEPQNPYRGKNEVRRFLAEYFATLRDVVVDITTVATTEDKVIGELDVTATYVGAPFSPRNGRSVVLRYVVIDTVRNGKVCHERFYWDREQLQRQLATAL